MKSDRLCKFLAYVCELSLQGREHEISEVNIGAQLFGRPNYDPTVDGIVRSHASRMRQRLDQYFEAEGANEPVRLMIPKCGIPPKKTKPAASAGLSFLQKEVALRCEA